MWEMNCTKAKEHLFDNKFRGIIESVEKVENIDY